MIFVVFDWNNKQNGYLVGAIGVLSALIQGGFVRRFMSKAGEGSLAQLGVFSCAIGLILLAALPRFVPSSLGDNYIAVKFLQAAVVCLAFTSATVVNALTSYASLQCDDIAINAIANKAQPGHPQLAKGRALGEFRSRGQLGRALGPLLSTSYH